MQERKIDQKNPLPTLDASEVERVELPQLDLAKLKLPDTGSLKTQLIESGDLEKDAKSLAESKSLQIDGALDWQVITDNLLVRVIIISGSDLYFSIGYVFNKESNQQYYLLGIDQNTDFVIHPDNPNCLIGINNQELRIWNLNKCEDEDCTLPRDSIFNFNTEGGFNPAHVQFFSQGAVCRLAMQSIQQTRPDTTSYKYYYLIDGLDTRTVEDVSSIHSPAIMWSTYNVNEHAEHTCQILNENEFLLIEYDISRNQNDIVFYKAQFNYPDHPSAEEFQRISVATLQINSEHYFCSFISPKGKYLVTVERCFHSRQFDYENCEFVFTSFALLKNEHGQYHYKKISQAKLAGHYWFGAATLSSEGFLKWNEDKKRHIWNIRTDQIMTIPLSFPQRRIIFHELHDFRFSLTGPRHEDDSIQDLLMFEIQDPRVAFEARSALPCLTHDVVSIVAGYVSKNTAAFFATNTCAISTLSILQKETNSENDQTVLNTFFSKPNQSPDISAREALKHHPSERIKTILDTLVKSFEDEAKVYNALTLTT